MQDVIKYLYHILPFHRAQHLDYLYRYLTGQDVPEEWITANQDRIGKVVKRNAQKKD